MMWLNRDALLEWLLKAKVEAMLVDSSEPQTPARLSEVKGRSGIGQVLRGKRIEDGTLYAADMKFPAVKTRVSACVVYVGDVVLAYQDGIVDHPTDPKGGDVLVPFSEGVLGV